MNFADGVKATGHVKFELFGPDGMRKLIHEVNNLVVTVGKNYIAGRMASNTPTIMGYMAVGSSATAPAVGDTALGGELGRVALTSGIAAGNVVTYIATFPAGTGTGAINEAGIFDAAAVGNMLAHVIATAGVINKGAGDSLTVTWTVTIN